MAYTFHPFPIIRAFNSLVTTIFLVLIIVYFQQYLGELYVPLIIVILLFGAVSILSMFAVANTFSITLDDTSITYRFGVLKRTEYVLPYSKISEARSSQGLFDQLLGLGSLTIDTPGFRDIPLSIRDIRSTDIRKAIDAINGNNAQAPKN